MDPYRVRLGAATTSYSRIATIAILLVCMAFGAFAPGTAIAETKIAYAHDLSLSVSDSPDPVVAGNLLTYTISFSNNGTDSATGVAVTQFAPAGTFFATSSVQAPAAGWNNTITPDGSGGFGAQFTKDTVASGETATFTVTVRVDATTASGSVINGSATVTANETDEYPADDTATEQTTVSTQADLGVVMTDSPDPATPGSNITYLITLSNSGPSSAQDVTMTLPTPTSTTYVSANLNAGSGWTITSAPSVGGTGNVVFSRSTVGKSEGAVFQIVVKSSSAITDGGDVSASATAASTTTDPVASNNTATATTFFHRKADLDVDISDAPDPADAGDTITYTIPYTNNGPNSAASVEVTLPTPANTSFVSASINSGTGWGSSAPSVGGTGDVTFEKYSSPSGDTAELEVVVKVDPATASGTAVGANVSATNQIDDPDLTNNSASTLTTTTARANAQIHLSDSPDPVVAGANLTYTVSYDNAGPSNANSVTVLQAVPVNTTFVSASASTGTGWSLSSPAVGGAGNVIFSKTASGPSDSAEFEIVVKVGAGTANGTTINASASATSSTTEASPGDESDSASTSVEVKADLQTTLGDSPDPVIAGENLTYTVSFTNAGPSDAADSHRDSGGTVEH